jgi:hypothetical protein
LSGKGKIALFETIEEVRPVETVPTPGAVVSLGDDRMRAALRLTLFLCVLAVDIGAIIDYHGVITAHMPLLLGMVALAVGCLAGALFHIVPDYMWQRKTIQRTKTLYDDWMERRNVALDMALAERGDEADSLPGEEVSTGPDLGLLHAAAYRILYRHYALKRETTREVCQTEEGITQPVWNAVNERLRLAGIRPTGRNWDQSLDFATAWAKWLQAESPRLATLEMAARPPGAV